MGASSGKPVQVAKEQVAALTESVGTAPHPLKGNCLFALRAIKAGEVICHTKLEELMDTRHESIADFEKYLESLPDEKAKQDVLEHTVPSVLGTVAQLKSTDLHVRFNHARPHNAKHDHRFYSNPEWNTVAVRDIPAGEELVIDYDMASGYEVRPNEPHVAEFLKLADKYGIEKRPSVLTLPPACFNVLPSQSPVPVPDDVVKVPKAQVTFLTDAAGTAPHPVKGNCLFALRAIKAGEVICHTKLEELVETRHGSIADFQKYLESLPDKKAKQDVLEHTVPSVLGTVMRPHPSNLHVLFNHARPHNAKHDHRFYSNPEWDTVAVRDIAAGEELAIDYDMASGYEVRPNEPHVAEFLKIADKYGIEKRASALTLPPARFAIETN